MIAHDHDLPSLKLFTLNRFGDDRGFSFECWNQQRFAEAGFTQHFRETPAWYPDSEACWRPIQGHAKPVRD